MSPHETDNGDDDSGGSAIRTGEAAESSIKFGSAASCCVCATTMSAARCLACSRLVARSRLAWRCPARSALCPPSLSHASAAGGGCPASLARQRHDRGGVYGSLVFLGGTASPLV